MKTPQRFSLVDGRHDGLNIENVVDIFGRLSSLAAEDIIKFRFMCENAVDNVKSYIKSDVNTSAYDGRLCFAAASLAYYRYVLWSLTDGGNDEIKMGEFSIKPAAEKRLDAAAKLCKEAFKELMDIMRDDSFVFERI